MKTCRKEVKNVAFLPADCRQRAVVIAINLFLVAMWGMVVYATILKFLR